MKASQIAYRLRTLFEQKITAEYFALFKGRYGRVQVEVLNYLYDHSEARIQTLADVLDIPKQHASKIMLRLEEQGLVSKAADPLDGRSFIFTLNDAGKQLMTDYVRKSNLLFEERLEKLTPEEQQMLVQAMEQIVSVLEKL